MNPRNYVVRCERCFRSIRITNMKQLERFKETHTQNTCGHYIPTFGRYAEMCREMGAEMRRIMFEGLFEHLERKRELLGEDYGKH